MEDYPAYSWKKRLERFNYMVKETLEANEDINRVTPACSPTRYISLLKAHLEELTDAFVDRNIQKIENLCVQMNLCLTALVTDQTGVCRSGPVKGDCCRTVPAYPVEEKGA